MAGAAPAWPLVVDHKYGDRTDLRWKNLLVSTLGSNRHNSKKTRSNTGVRNVKFDHGRSNVFEVVIKKDFKTYRAGCIKSLEEAITIRDKMKKELYPDVYG